MADRTILHVVGARPNLVKIAPLMAAMRSEPRVRQVLVHTGQHYTPAMASDLLAELDLPAPDHNLDVGSGTHAVQTAQVMMRFEQVCLSMKPDLVVVVGDVNSTMAATLVAAKLLIPVAHVEAGLRSFDLTMPEEVNRVVTDRLAHLLLTASRDGDENLRLEGVPAERVHLVGNTMVDTLQRHLPSATFDRIRNRVPVEERRYALLTLHRPSNVDDAETLRGILVALKEIANTLPIVFPVHPRTRARITAFGLEAAFNCCLLTEPLGYIDCLSLSSHARIVLTDSGGLQEESTALGVPCLTLRENTERPVTITEGTNRLVGVQAERILAGFHDAMTTPPSTRRPPLWDGHTAERIREVFRKHLFG
jgi:UDP-N-acetylglucosamine 2-epimerase (non-hydrolysing)